MVRVLSFSSFYHRTHGRHKKGAYHVWWQAADRFSVRPPDSLTRDPRFPISVRWLSFRPGLKMRGVSLSSPVICACNPHRRGPALEPDESPGRPRLPLPPPLHQRSFFISFFFSFSAIAKQHVSLAAEAAAPGVKKQHEEFSTCVCTESEKERDGLFETRGIFHGAVGGTGVCACVCGVAHAHKRSLRQTRARWSAPRERAASFEKKVCGPVDLNGFAAGI